MKSIEIEDDLYKYILANIEAFGETPSQILRRLLSLPDATENNPAAAADALKPASSSPKMSIVERNTPEQPADADVSLPSSLANGVQVLFDSEVFKRETIITHKFMMMLATMYHENKDAFVAAAEKTKGRTRDYLGQNLKTLLATDNEEELALFKASKPRDIPYTPFWVITNANTGRKRIIITQMMASMGYPHHLIERIKDEI
ncbi:MAG TPA: replication initiation regulator SeqA [Psychromonas sp.]